MQCEIFPFQIMLFGGTVQKYYVKNEVLLLNRITYIEERIQVL